MTPSLFSFPVRKDTEAPRRSVHEDKSDKGDILSEILKGHSTLQEKRKQRKEEGEKTVKECKNKYKIKMKGNGREKKKPLSKLDLLC